MKMVFKWLLPVILMIFSGSCKKTSTAEPPAPVADTTKPAISVADPTPGKTYAYGTNGTVLHLQMDLSDNAELKSYEVVINKSLKGLEMADWSFSQTWNITAGKKTLAVNHSEINIPALVTGKQTTTGNYEVTIFCTDVAGNKASSALSIVLTK
jgi:hypothetical protein